MLVYSSLDKSPDILFLFIYRTGITTCSSSLRGIYQQGCNARKVISEVFTSFVLQCTVSGRWSKHKTDVTAWHGIHLSHKKSMKYSGHRKLLCALSKLSNLMLLTSSDTKRTLMHLSLFTNSAQRELYAEYTRPQLTFLALHPCTWIWLR